MAFISLCVWIQRSKSQVLESSWQFSCDMNIKYCELQKETIIIIPGLLTHEVCFSWILYIYCPVWRETRRFVPPGKFMSPEGDMNFLGGTKLRVSRLTGQLIVYYTESCSTTLYSAERCAVRHDRETRRFVLPPRDFSRPITFLYSSYQLYEV